MSAKKLEFPGSHNATLRALLDQPDAEARAYALFAHCFTCSKNLKAITHISRALTERGIAVLRFDFTGLGESEGDFADTNFSSNIEDLIAAAEFLAREYDSPRILIGHSLGGAAVLQAAHEIDSVLAIATIAAPYDPDHVSELLGEDLEVIEEKGEAAVTIGGRTFTIRKQFLEDLRGDKPKQRIESLRLPLVIFHSPIDNVVGIDNAALIFQAAKHPKSFISLDNADHLLSREDDARYVGAMIAEWSSRYV